MAKRILETCPHCGDKPTLNTKEIYKLIGSPEPTHYIYFYACDCDKIVTPTATDMSMTKEEAIDYAAALWNAACSRVVTKEQPAAEPTQEVVVQEEAPVVVEKPTRSKAKKKAVVVEETPVDVVEAEPVQETTEEPVVVQTEVPEADLQSEVVEEADESNEEEN